MEGLTKACSTCGVDKPFDKFYPYRPQCKDCKRKWRENYNASISAEVKRDRQFATNLKKRYQMTVEQYNELTASGCAVCGTHENLHIDHDHGCCPGEFTCGNCVRGVLCRPHNQGEGYFKSIEEIAGLMAYRMKFEVAQIVG